MKSSLLHSISMLLVLTFSVACGKSSSGGGKTIDLPNVANTLVSTAAGEDAYAELKAWYTAADSTILGTDAYYLRKTENNNLSIDLIMCTPGNVNTIFGIEYGNPICTAPTGCFKRTQIGVQIGKVIMEGDNGKRYKECDINSEMKVYEKSTDQNLKDHILGKSDLYVIPGLTTKTGSMYEVSYGSTVGSSVVTSKAVFNTTLPAIVNPTRIPVGTTKSDRLVIFLLKGF